MIEVKRFVSVLENAGKVYCVDTKSTEVFDKLFTNKDIDVFQFERPDIIVIGKNKNILLEQFQFDGSKSIKKSSSQKREEAEFERCFEKDMLTSIENKIKINKRFYKNTSTLENYEANLNRIFDKHLVKYNDYIANYTSFKKKKTKSSKIFNDVFEFGFIIEDTTLLTNIMITDEHNKYLLTPFHFDSFKERLKNNQNVKHIFFITHDGADRNIVYYFYNSGIEGLSIFSIKNNDRHLSLPVIQVTGTIKIKN